MKKKASEYFSQLKASRFLLLALSVSLIWALIVLWPQLSDWYRVPNDFQNHYWMAKFQNPELFPDDRLQWADDLLQIRIFDEVVTVYPMSLGYGLLFYFASAIVDPILFGKLLVFFLLPVSVVLLFRIGNKIGGKNTGIVLSLLFTFIIFASPDSISIASGLQRAFAIPLMIAFLYCLLETKTIWAAALIFMGTLIYLPVVPIMVMSYGFEILWFQRKPFSIQSDFSKRKVIPFIVAMGIVLIIAGWAISIRLDRLSSPIGDERISDPSILDDPRRSAGGPIPLFIRFPWLGRAGFFDIDRDLVNFLVLIILSAMIFIILPPEKRTAVPGAALKVLLSGVILYVLSLFVLVTFDSTLLYLPSRYTRVVLVLCPLIFVGLNFGELMTKMRTLMQRHLRWVYLGLALGLTLILVTFLWMESILLTMSLLGVMVILLPGIAISHIINIDADKFRVPGYLLASLLSILALTPGFLYSRALGVFCIDPSNSERELYRYVATLPEDAVFAGSPEELTGIPLFSKRTVLFRRLFPAKDAPIVPMFEAYYAEDGEEILAFCEQYGVDYWVIDGGDFLKEYIKDGEFFFAPYNAQIQDIVSSRNAFALPRAEKSFVSGDLAVIPCSPASIPQGDIDS